MKLGGALRLPEHQGRPYGIANRAISKLRVKHSNAASLNFQITCNCPSKYMFGIVAVAMTDQNGHKLLLR